MVTSRTSKNNNKSHPTYIYLQFEATIERFRQMHKNRCSNIHQRQLREPPITYQSIQKIDVISQNVSIKLSGKLKVCFSACPIIMDSYHCCKLPLSVIYLVLMMPLHNSASNCKTCCNARKVIKIKIGTLYIYQTGSHCPTSALSHLIHNFMYHLIYGIHCRRS